MCHERDPQEGTTRSRPGFARLLPLAVLTGAAAGAIALLASARPVQAPASVVVVATVSVGGPAYWGEPYASEVGIPRKYGIDQSVADTGRRLPSIRTSLHSSSANSTGGAAP